MAQINDVKVRLATDSTINGKEHKRGTTLKVADIIGKEGYWDIERKGKVVATAILHRKIQELATLAGVNVVEEKVLSYPSLENRMHTMWQFTVDMPVLNDKGEPDGDKRTPHVTEIGVGTADDNAGSEYMARKRAYDRAVLDLFGLYDVYSDVEATQFEDKGDKPVKLEDLPVKERNSLGAIISDINGAKSTAELKTLGESLKVRVAEVNASENAIKVVRTLYAQKKTKLEAAEKITDTDPV